MSWTPRAFALPWKASALVLGLLLSGAALAAPDEDVLGKSAGYPVCAPGRTLWTPGCLVGSTSNLGTLLPANKVEKPAAARPLKRAPVEPKFTYTHNLFSGGVDDYLARNRTTGLLVMQGDTILLERYQYGRTPEHRLTSFSVAKTFVAMLVGIAVGEGKIASIDDLAEKYVPELKGSSYGQTPIRHLLSMSSGVRFTEDYYKESDITLLGRNVLGGQSPGGPAALAPWRDREREVPAGTRYHYASSETHVLGLVLRGATGRTLSEYLSEKIWKPMGAEAEAYWNIDRAGYEAAYAFLNATLRDYARFGMLLANDGLLDGRQIIPRDWVIAATSLAGPHTGFGRVVNYFGYGYQTWILPSGERRFQANGFRGQVIFVDAKNKTVIVHTGVRDGRDPGYREQTSLMNSIADQLAAQNKL